MHSVDSYMLPVETNVVPKERLTKSPKSFKRIKPKHLLVLMIGPSLLKERNIGPGSRLRSKSRVWTTKVDGWTDHVIGGIVVEHRF